jgi:hypothetical protein
MQALVNLRKVFGAMRPLDVLARHIYKYVDTRVDTFEILASDVEKLVISE